MNKLIIFLLVVVLLGVGGYFIFKGGYKTGGQTPTAQQNQPPAAAENKVIIRNFAFNPTTLTVKKGITVVWTNEDDVSHRIKSDTFNSEILSKGASFQFKFDNIGTYDYSCAIHPTMKGKIIVQD